MNPQDPYHPPTPQTNPPPPIMPPIPSGEPQPAPPRERQPSHERVSKELSVMQAGEVKICDIKRHPIGIFGIYGMIGFLLIVMAILAFIVAPRFLSDSGGNEVSSVGVGIFFILAVIGLLYAMIASIVYWGNSWILTSDSITQVTQSSLFNRQSSQLSLHSLEDVTAEQNGLLTHVFNYGVLRVETAGHHGKFVFLYCPNPNYYAKKVIEAHEAFEQKLEHAQLAEQQPQGNPNQQRGWPLPPQS